MKTNLTATKLSNIVDLVSALMMSKEQFDMETVQTCVEAEMSRTGVAYVPYDVIIRNNWFDFNFTFEDTAELFFDRINNMAINKDKIDAIVSICMEGGKQC